MPFIPDTLENNFKPTVATPGFIPDTLDFQSQNIQPQAIPKPKSLYGKISEGVGKFSTGFAKGELQTLQGLSRFGGKVASTLNLPGQITELATGGKYQAPESQPLFSEPTMLKMKPQGGLETAGNITEKVAEFLAPSGIIKKGTSAIAMKTANLVTDPVLKWFINTGIKSGIGAITSGGQTALQREGRIDNAVKVNALISALIPPIASGLSAVGKKIGFSVIKPSQADLRDVKGPPSTAAKTFADNVYKYDVGGSLKDSAFKIETKMQGLTEQLNNALKEEDLTVDISKAYYNTYKELYNAPRTFGNTQSINGSLGRLAQEIDNTTGGSMEVVPLLTANQIKQGAGSKGAWVYGRIDPEGVADEVVYSKFYSKVREIIDTVGSPKIRRINQALSDLIPIRNAVLRRIPVASRNNLLSLTTDMGLFASIFDPKALSMVAADAMSKSGKFANFLVNAADSYVRQITGSVLKTGVSSIPTNQPVISNPILQLSPRVRQ